MGTNTTHRFVNDKGHICDLTIYIKQVNSIYRVDYCYAYSHDSPLRTVNKAHPLYKFSQLAIKYSDGVSITKNALTEQLVHFIKMDDDTLATNTGVISPMEYRRSILLMFANLCIY